MLSSSVIGETIIEAEHFLLLLNQTCINIFMAITAIRAYIDEDLEMDGVFGTWEWLFETCT